MPAPEATEPVMNAHDAEKAEEEKLKAKYPGAAVQGLRAPSGHSAFLQKRLQKNVSDKRISGETRRTHSL